ncbi:MAG TPA: hypothetical protein VH170_03525 [Chthoniobacterales bacterium]|jgi:hypothetical protein|nr:hypothetical protein [Chthoniobacterales bacterium]
MHFRLRKFVAITSTAALLLFCSCEKHHLGEAPEVQKEHVDPVQAGGEEKSSAAEKKGSESQSVSPTPANFFPQSTPAP